MTDSILVRKLYTVNANNPHRATITPELLRGADLSKMAKKIRLQCVVTPNIRIEVIREGEELVISFRLRSTIKDWREGGSYLTEIFEMAVEAAMIQMVVIEHPLTTQ